MKSKDHIPGENVYKFSLKMERETETSKWYSRWRGQVGIYLPVSWICPGHRGRSRRNQCTENVRESNVGGTVDRGLRTTIAIEVIHQMPVASRSAFDITLEGDSRLGDVARRRPGPSAIAVAVNRRTTPKRVVDGIGRRRSSAGRTRRRRRRTRSSILSERSRCLGAK